MILAVDSTPENIKQKIQTTLECPQTNILFDLSK